MTRMTLTQFDRVLVSTLALLALGTLARGQTVAEGYEGSITALPAGAGQPLQLDDAVVYFTGTELVLRKGSRTRQLLALPTPVFGSFTIRTGPGRLLFGESSSGDLWSVGISSGTPIRLANLNLNYSATSFDADHAIVSAKTGGLSSKTNELFAVDLRTGALDLIAVLPGASGPVGTDGHGNIYYVTASDAFPAPRGQAVLLMFSAAQVQGAFGPSQLDASGAAVVYRGLDAAGSIALDDDQDLFLTDWMNAQVLEISEVHSPHPRLAVLASYSAPSMVTAAAVQFVAGRRWGPGVQEFEPFQPVDGGTLILHESAFGSTSQLRTLTSARPTTSVGSANPVPPATPFDVVVRGGRASGMGFIALAVGAHRHELAFRLGHSEAPVFWSAALLTPAILAGVAFDSTGTAKLKLFNPGFTTPLELSCQAYFDAPGSSGSSVPLQLRLR